MTQEFKSMTQSLSNIPTCIHHGEECVRIHSSPLNLYTTKILTHYITRVWYWELCSQRNARLKREKCLTCAQSA